MTTFKQAEAELAALTPEERKARVAQIAADARKKSLVTLAGAAGVGFLVAGPVGLVAAPAALLGLAMLLGNR